MLGASTASCERGTRLEVELHDAKATLYRTPNAYDIGGYRKVVIMGAGLLAQSFVPATGTNGDIKVVGMFDTDPGKVGRKCPNGMVVESDDYLPARVVQHCVKKGIIAVPAMEAQRAANALVDAGVQVILNYAPVNLSVPLDVLCEKLDPSIQFASIRPSVSSRSLLGGLFAPFTRLNSDTYNMRFNSTLASTISCWQYPVAPDVFEDIEDSDHEKYDSFFGFLVSERRKKEYRERSPRAMSSGFVRPHVQSNVRLEKSVKKCSPQKSDCEQLPTVWKHKEIHSSWQVRQPPNVTFRKVSGLEKAKSALLEALTQRKASFKSMLLYGPPGCGKTMLARAAVAEMFESYSFFTVPCSDLINGSRGSLRALVDHAASVGPSVILVDNLQVVTKHKALKAELFDALERLQEPIDVKLIAATNLPWDLDISTLRHFEKRISVGLPDATTRKALFMSSHHVRKLLEDNSDESELGDLVLQTGNYSCSDLCLIMKDALMQPIRRKENGSEVFFADFQKSCMEIRPTISQEIIELYDSFENKFGQSISPPVDTKEGRPHEHYAIYS